MAITISDLSKAIRASVEDPAGTTLADVTRLHGALTALIDRYAMAAPESVKDLALIQAAQYLYDAPPNQRRVTTNALRESGASSLLAPYRSHRVGIADQLVAMSGGGGNGLDQENVDARIRALVEAWALIERAGNVPISALENTLNDYFDGEAFRALFEEILSDTPIPLALIQGSIDNRIGALVKSFAQSGSSDQVPGTDVAIATGSFDGNLGSGDDTVQKVAQKVDDLVITGGTGGGLSQAQVDARILAAIPLNRRLPNPSTFTASDNGVFGAWNEADDAFVNAGLLDKNGFTWTYDSTTNFWELDSDKLNQAEVDGRINTAIPVARRIPGFAIGDANEYLRVNADGTALIFAPGPTSGIVSQATVYAQIKEIAKQGHRVTLTFNDDANELTIAVNDVPAGNSFPANPSVGERFRLLMADSIHNDELRDIVEGTEVPATMTATVSFGSGLPRIISYAPNYSGAQASTLAGKTFLVYAGAPTDLATNVICYAPGASRTKYAVNQSSIGGSFPHFYEIPTLTIAILRLLSAQAGVESEDDALFNLDLTSGGQIFPDSEFDPGDYTYAGGSAHWELTPGVAAPWATQGQPEPRTSLSVESLIDGPGTGITTNNSSDDTFGPFQTLNFSIADKRGILEIEVDVSFTARSDNTISFDSDSIITESSITGFTFSSAIDGLTPYASPNTRGRRIGTIRAYRGSTRLGNLSFYIVRDASRNVGYYWRYDGSAGAFTFSISARISIAFLVNDAAESGSATFLGLTDTPQSFSGAGGRSLQVNAAGTAVEFAESEAVTFVSLMDTPNSFTGEAGKVLQVNAAGTAVEFAEKGSAASETRTLLNSYTNVPFPANGSITSIGASNTYGGGVPSWGDELDDSSVKAFDIVIDKGSRQGVSRLYKERAGLNDLYGSVVYGSLGAMVALRLRRNLLQISNVKGSADTGWSIKVYKVT